MPVTGFHQAARRCLRWKFLPHPTYQPSWEREEDEENNMEAADVTGLYRRMLRHICQSVLALFLRVWISETLYSLPPPGSWSIWEKDRLNTCFGSFIMKPVEEDATRSADRDEEEMRFFVSSVTFVRAACVCWPPPGRHRKKRESWLFGSPPTEPLPNMCRFRLKSPNVLSCWPWIIERRRQQSRTTRNAPGNL